jgi:hypothetical protein
MKKIALIVVGLIFSALGGLWLVQGLGVVHIEPIACIAECETLDAPSVTWAAIGAVVLAGGLFALFRAFRRTSR